MRPWGPGCTPCQPNTCLHTRSIHINLGSVRLHACISRHSYEWHACIASCCLCVLVSVAVAQHVGMHVHLHAGDGKCRVSKPSSQESGKAPAASASEELGKVSSSSLSLL